MNKSGVKIYDIECLSNFFCYCDIDRDTGEKNTFVIHESINQLTEFCEYLLRNRILHVGFNNINYDAQVIHQILLLSNTFKGMSGDAIARHIFTISNEAIRRSNTGEKPYFNHWEFRIPQLDLFKIWHYDNRARSTRLKDLQVAMKWGRVQDMPIHHTHPVSNHEIALILDYCDNDIMSTFEFYKKTRERIDLRLELEKEYGIKCLNSNDAKLGSQIFAKIISQNKGIELSELHQMRTNREIINIDECILGLVKYNSWEFQYALNKFKAMEIRDTKGVLDFSVNYKGFKYDFGLGGIHGCINSGVYESTKTHIIKSCDVTSLYPSISIQHSFYPFHLGPEFVDIYNLVFERRNEAKRKSKLDKSDKSSRAINEGLKLALNGSYGKSNERTSFFYDPKFTMSITINGQLMLTMLAERLQQAGFKMLMINTDGLECIVPIDEEEKYNQICKEWEKETKLSLEFVDYKKMIIRDVNNYIAITTDDDVKYKGCFEVVKDYHKDPSFPIVAIALSEYFIFNIPIEETVNNMNGSYTEIKDGKKTKKEIDILDYAGRAKFKSDSHGEMRTVKPGLILHKEKQQKTTRYLVTKTGATFVKVYTDGRESFINKGYQCREFNNLVIEDDYNLNYQFYIDECNKIKNVIEPKTTQLSMF